MSGSTHQPDRFELCRESRGQIQAYLDGDLPRDQALAIFLHARDCVVCGRELESCKALVVGLSSLPALNPPPGFDETVLRALPYDHYREMAPLRSARLPIYLEEAYLPEVLRAPATRAGGIAVAAVAGAALLSGWLPSIGFALCGAGLVPEVLVRLQRLARRMRLAARRAESG